MKQYKYTDKDIKKLMSSLVMLVDTREKQNSHILDYFTKNHITYERTALSYGDYCKPRRTIWQSGTRKGKI